MRLSPECKHVEMEIKSQCSVEKAGEGQMTP